MLTNVTNGSDAIIYLACFKCSHLTFAIGVFVTVGFEKLKIIVLA